MGAFSSAVAHIPPPNMGMIPITIDGVESPRRPLLIDEFGFVPFDKTESELIFNLLADRYERRRLISNQQADDEEKVEPTDPRQRPGSQTTMTLSIPEERADMERLVQFFHKSAPACAQGSTRSSADHDACSPRSFRVAFPAPRSRASCGLPSSLENSSSSTRSGPFGGQWAACR